jgi:triosephosphate isomerase
MTSKIVIGGNWKMKLGIQESIESIQGLIHSTQNLDLNSLEIFIAPSFVSLRDVSLSLKASPIKLAAQNMSEFELGGYTGEISPIWLKELGCEYVILGHSERRRIFGETSELVNKKIHNALNHGLKPVLCIGETAEERSNGQKEFVNTTQLKDSLKGVSLDQIKNIIIAYEPVWAINSRGLNPTGEIIPATSKQAEEMHKFIRNWLISTYGNEGKDISIQYGGSVNPGNAKQFFSIESVDGGLIGTASLKPEEFVEVIKAAL